MALCHVWDSTQDIDLMVSYGVALELKRTEDEIRFMLKIAPARHRTTFKRRFNYASLSKVPSWHFEMALWTDARLKQKKGSRQMT